MFKVALVWVGMVIGILTVFLMEALIQPPEFGQAVVSFIYGLASGGVLVGVLGLMFITMIVSVINHERVKAQAAQQYQPPSETPPMGIPIEEPDYDSEDAFLYDSDFWKHR